MHHRRNPKQRPPNPRPLHPPPTLLTPTLTHTTINLTQYIHNLPYSTPHIRYCPYSHTIIPMLTGDPESIADQTFSLFANVTLAPQTVRRPNPSRPNPTGAINGASDVRTQSSRLQKQTTIPEDSFEPPASLSSDLSTKKAPRPLPTPRSHRPAPLSTQRQDSVLTPGLRRIQAKAAEQAQAQTLTRTQTPRTARARAKNPVHVLGSATKAQIRHGDRISMRDMIAPVQISRLHPRKSRPSSSSSATVTAAGDGHCHPPNCPTQPQPSDPKTASTSSSSTPCTLAPLPSCDSDSISSDPVPSTSAASHPALALGSTPVLKALNQVEKKTARSAAVVFDPVSVVRTADWTPPPAETMGIDFRPMGSSTPWVPSNPSLPPPSKSVKESDSKPAHGLLARLEREQRLEDAGVEANSTAAKDLQHDVQASLPVASFDDAISSRRTDSSDIVSQIGQVHQAELRVPSPANVHVMTTVTTTTVAQTTKMSSSSSGHPAQNAEKVPTSSDTDFKRARLYSSFRAPSEEPAVQTDAQIHKPKKTLQSAATSAERAKDRKASQEAPPMNQAEPRPDMRCQSPARKPVKTTSSARLAETAPTKASKSLLKRGGRDVVAPIISRTGTTAKASISRIEPKTAIKKTIVQTNSDIQMGQTDPLRSVEEEASPSASTIENADRLPTPSAELPGEKEDDIARGSLTAPKVLKDERSHPRNGLTVPAAPIFLSRTTRQPRPPAVVKDTGSLLQRPLRKALGKVSGTHAASSIPGKKATTGNSLNKENGPLKTLKDTQSFHFETEKRAIIRAQTDDRLRAKQIMEQKIREENVRKRNQFLEAERRRHDPANTSHMIHANHSIIDQQARASAV